MPEDQARDDRLMTLFEEAAKLPEHEQREYLAEAAVGDAALAEEVWERLQWERKMGGFLLQPVVARPDLPATVLTPGQVLNERFEIVRFVAEGGMAAVYEAIDRKQGQRIAIKCPKPAFQQRLPPELRSAMEVSHDNICRVQAIHTATVEERSVDFLTMEFLDGETLRVRMKRGALPEPEFRTIARQICSGLSAAHRKGVVHGDLKSANIILTTAADKSVRAVITDFGLARRLFGTAPGDFNVFGEGTPDYASPEIWKGQSPSMASDIYALGVILHEMLTGLLPSHHEAKRMVGGLPRRYRAIVAACMAEDPGKRPQTAEEVTKALESNGSGRATWLAGIVLAAFGMAGGGHGLPRSSSPTEPVRLAVMPFDVGGAVAAIGTGIAHDLSDRLAGLRASNGHFTSIPFGDVAQSGVSSPGTARTALGATHALQVRISESAKGILARARVIELATGQPVSALDGEYDLADVGALPNAITGAVTAALHLNAPRNHEGVNMIAYGDYARGLALLRGSPDRADDAIAALESAAGKDGASPLPHASLAEALALRFQQTEQHQWRERAEAAIRQARLRNPDAVEVHLAAGLLNQLSGMHEQAVAEFVRALQIEPSNLDALRRMGMAYEAMNLPDEAAHIYRRAIGLDPGYFQPHMDLGGFYYFRSIYEKAAEEFGEVVRIAPALAQGHFNKGAALMDMGRYEPAEAEFQEAIRLRGTRDDLIGMGAVRAYQRKFTESTMFYEMARGKGPDSALLLSNLADSYRRTNRPFDSSRTYEEALRLADENLLHNPRDAYMRAMVGYISARRGDNERGDREIRQAMRLAPEDMKVRRWAVLAWWAMGRSEQALEELRQAPAALVAELNRQPDLMELQHDSRFLILLANSSR